MREYEDRIVEFLLSEVIPSHCIPLAYVLVGQRAQETFPIDAPYKIRGIHIIESQELLAHPRFRDDWADSAVKHYDITFEPTDSASDAHLSVESYEWWRFLDEMIRGTQSCYELVFMPTVYEDRNVMLELTPLLLNMVSKSGLQLKARAFSMPNPKMARRALTALFQAEKLLKQGDFEWDEKALVAEFGNDIDRKIFIGEFDFSNPIMFEMFLEHLNRIESRVKKAWLKSELPPGPPRNVIKRADTIIKRWRLRLI